MPEAQRIECEVAYALAGRQEVVSLTLPLGSTAIDALRASGLLEKFPEIDAVAAPLGVFGRVVAPDHPLAMGDRLEVYRPLSADPRIARRARARTR